MVFSLHCAQALRYYAPMAIANRTAAVAQYQANLRYWESTATAANLLEAILYLLQEDAASWSVGGQSIQRQDLKNKADELHKIVMAAGVGTNARTSIWARARVTGMGNP